MLFTDPAYLFLFLPIVAFVCAGVRSRFGVEWALAFLFVASCAFYVGWGVDYLIMMLASILVNWAASQSLIHLGDDRKPLRRAIFWAGIAFNFGALIWFKYSFFFLNYAESSAAFHAGLVAIPVGISFYTFQQAVFLLDAYRRDREVIDYLGTERGARGRARGFVRYAAFIAFFPQLVIGPIVYLKEFAPQVRNADFGRLVRINIEVGLFLIIVGLFKKVLIADNIARYVDPVFDMVAVGGEPNLIDAWTAALGYYAQLYFDFSGYSDMALGSARILGIILPINFASPLKANSIGDFYRRWHITLTRVIALFMYTPLSLFGARFAARHIKWKPLARFPLIWLPLLVNFEVIALWHGATMTFVLFGLLHGLWYVLETEAKKTSAWRTWKSRSSETARNIIGRVAFTVPMVLCFSLFRSESVTTWSHLVGAMFGQQALPLDQVGLRDVGELALVFAILGFCWFLPNAYELARDHKPGLFTWTYPANRNLLARIKWAPNIIWGGIMAGALLGTLYYVSRLPPFIYLGF
ncbi:MBOAT family O-acyltransferase [Citromicrobium bathyomarinum]